MERNEEFCNRGKMVKCIDGISRGYNKCIGFCNNICHKGFVTTKLLKQHKCIERGCIFLDPMRNHWYWIELEKKKAHKLEIKKHKEMERLILEKTKELYSKKVEVVMCKHLYDSTYLLIVIKTNIDIDLSKQFMEQIGIKVYIRGINKRQKENIQYTYKLLLPENMLKKHQKDNEPQKHT